MDIPLPSTAQNERCIVPLRLTRLQAQGEGDTQNRRAEYGVTYISSGYVRREDGTASNWILLPEALQGAVDKFGGVGMNIDHPKLANWFAPSLRDTAGVTFDPKWNADGLSIDGGARLYKRDDILWLRQFLDEILEDQEAGREVPDVGLSAVLFHNSDWFETANGEEKRTTEITHVVSVDYVFGPGAEGRLREALQFMQQFSMWMPQPGQDQPASGRGEQQMSEETEVQGQAQANTESAQVASPSTPPPEAHSGQAQNGNGQNGNDELNARVGQIEQAVLNISQQLGQMNDLLSANEENNVVQGMGIPPRTDIRAGLNSLERVEAAFNAMLAGVLPPAGVQPLSGIRELYHLLSGDWEMNGVYKPDRVYLANVNTSTMAGLVANALNKRIVNMFAEYPRWWAPAVTEMDFQSLQDVRWITLGGIGELPTVGEGKSYTELDWDDQTETKSFIKKGGYLGITLESIDKDDTGQMRAAPAALARAAWITLGKSISAIFTDNSGTGPAMSDGNNLFDNSNHSNLSTTATFTPANWRATKIAMMKQTELHSGEILGPLTKPYLLWVPVDLEDYAAEVLGSEGKADTANNNVNVDAEGETRTARLAMARQRIISCPLWTDTNNWAAQADPRLYPSIGIGYRYGRTPEIFSVASPTAGLMFTNDTMPIKVRFFFAVGPTDWRGLYKVNVT